MKESLEDIKKKYKLSEEEHKEIEKIIENIMLYDKYPVKSPTAIINIAPPASGKTGLNGFSTEQFIDNNVVIINSDELKPFHPKVEEIAKLYPEYYTKITDQESNTWTSNLFNKVLEEGYNVIFEGTGKNTRILNTITNRMSNYKVIVRGMAVNELNCLISILERYEYQVSTKGWGRLVTIDHFYETYKNMPETIDTLENSNLVDILEIYKRGETPVKPSLIYESKTPCKYVNAKQAVLEGRVEDIKSAIENYKNTFSRINRIVRSKPVTKEEEEFLKFIEEKYNSILVKSEKDNQR